MKKKQLESIVIPTLETTKEGKLRGGFSNIGNTGISVCGGPNKHCNHNSVCSDNDFCYDNSNSQLCSGNHAEMNCSSHHSSATPTSTSSSTFNRTTDFFSLF